MIRLFLGLCVAAALSAHPAVAADTQRQCFRSNDFRAYRAVSDREFLIRTNVNDYYRITTAQSCPELTYPQATLITQVHGSNLICGPVDWDLRVGQIGTPGGFAVGCIVASQRKLTPSEVAAIPKKDLP